MSAAPPLPPHGDRRRYGRPYNCDCDPCKEANRVYMRAYRAQRPRRARKHTAPTPPRPVRCIPKHVPPQEPHAETYLDRRLEAHIEGFTPRELQQARARTVHFVGGFRP